MHSADVPPVLVVGSIALDTIETPSHRREGILGGSASFAAAAAALFAPVRLVGVVGEDFPDRHRALLADRGVDLEGLEIRPGETFRWSGVYEDDMNARRTLSTCLNVFEAFDPRIPDSWLDSPFILLGNIAPDLQARVLDRVHRPQLVVADTMNLWIETTRDDLLALLPRVDVLTINDEEARMLTGETGLVRAGRRVLDLGPRCVVVKKGEHGSLIFSGDQVGCVPAFPLESVLDPTGAGDSFAGAITGALAQMSVAGLIPPCPAAGIDQPVGAGTDGAAAIRRPAAIRRAVAWGAVVASFVVEGFSLDGLAGVGRPQVDRRWEIYEAMARI